MAEVGDRPDMDQLYRISFDGSVHDEAGFISMGGDSESVGSAMKDNWSIGSGASETVRAAVKALNPDGEQGLDSLEVATLTRGRAGRCFRRCSQDDITELLG